MIKATVGESQKKEKPFPKLMVYSEKSGEKTIILAISKNNDRETYLGTCIYSEIVPRKIGVYNDSWSSEYKEYNEAIILQNED